MTTTTTVTRIGRAVAHGPINRVIDDGDRLRVSGVFVPADKTEWTSAGVWTGAAVAFRLQLAGLVGDEDDPIVPFTCSEYPELDGYYLINKADSELLPRVSTESGVVAWSVQMVRVKGGGGQTMVVSLRALAAERSTPFTLTLEERVWFPNSRQDFTFGDFDGATGSSNDIAKVDPYESVDTGGTVGGDVHIQRFQISDSSLPFSGGGEYFCWPEYYYNGACRFDFRSGSSAALSNFPAAGTIYKPYLSGGWKLSNGLIRISPWQDGSSNRVYLLEHWKASTEAWVSIAYLYRDYFTTSWQNGQIGTSTPEGSGIAPVVNSRPDPIILRNDPTTITIRIPHERGYEDLTIRRGMGYVEWSYYHELSRRRRIRATDTSAVAIPVTDQTSHMIATSDDANGYKLIVATDVANTVGTSAGTIEQDAAANSGWFTFGIDLKESSTDDEIESMFVATTTNQTVGVR